MKQKISVILCTHNPREEALSRTLESLRSQNLDQTHWELLLIDNRSEIAVEGRFDVSWHQNGRIIVESELGLTAARLRGIRESEADVLCFVDDDNELAADYLEQAVKIGRERPYLGCWGGEILPEYETPPPPWFHGYEDMLVVRPLERDQWGNAYRYDGAAPCGAGMCIRREVVDEYFAQCSDSTLRKSLDRIGTSTSSGGDIDMAFTAIDIGMGMGRFKAMRLLHLIPSGRLKSDYLARLAEGMAESNVFLSYVRHKHPENYSGVAPLHVKLLFWIRWLRSPKERKVILLGQRRGRARGCKRLEELRR